MHTQQQKKNWRNLDVYYLNWDSVVWLHIYEALLWNVYVVGGGESIYIIVHGSVHSYVQKSILPKRMPECTFHENRK